ncbi:30S ribosomal protein S16 [Alphaproteobacteria bacterium]|nr:30S ribosomal protein S16 [Alphaproteobacteria bacterium]
MPVRIRLSRGGAKKRPYYRIVVADSRRARDGKFIEQIGTYNPMLTKDNPERVKIDLDKAKDWIGKGAQPSNRVQLFLSSMGVGEKPIITEKTKKHLPKKKTKEKEEAKEEAKPAEAKEEAKPAEAKAAEEK